MMFHRRAKAPGRRKEDQIAHGFMIAMAKHECPKESVRVVEVRGARWLFALAIAGALLIVWVALPGCVSLSRYDHDIGDIRGKHAVEMLKEKEECLAHTERMINLAYEDAAKGIPECCKKHMEMLKSGAAIEVETTPLGGVPVLPGYSSKGGK